MPLVRVSDPRRSALMRRNTMLVRGRGLRGLSGPSFVSGIPDSPTCGVNPCGLWDDISSSPACLAFVQCADPTDFSSWLAGRGALLPSVAAQAGSDVSSTVTGTIDSFLNSVFNPGNPNPTTTGINWLVVGGIVVGALLLPRLVKA